MQHFLAIRVFLVVSLAIASGSAQSADSHAPSGEFKQPTPATRFRQLASRDNLVHPPGYLAAPFGSFGEVVEQGEGEIPVILLAGLGPSWRIFNSLIEAEKANHHFLAVTLAGYGGSSAPPMPAPETGFAEGTWLAGSRKALGSLIEERDLKRPVIVAFYSDAARIALRFALESPEKVGAILVMSASARFPLPPNTPRGPALDSFAQNWFKTVTEIMWPSGMWPTNAYANNIALAEKTWWDVLQPSLPTAIRYTVETWADDLVPDLALLKTPACVLSPGFDEEYLKTPSGATIQARFHDGWDSAMEAGSALEHTIVPGARLLLWEDQPEEVHAALQRAVEQRSKAIAEVERR